MSAELQKIASKAVNRAHIKRTAGMELAASKGYAAACTTSLERSSTLRIFICAGSRAHCVAPRPGRGGLVLTSACSTLRRPRADSTGWRSWSPEKVLIIAPQLVEENSTRTLYTLHPIPYTLHAKLLARSTV